MQVNAFQGNSNVYQHLLRFPLKWYNIGYKAEKFLAQGGNAQYECKHGDTKDFKK